MQLGLGDCCVGASGESCSEDTEGDSFEDLESKLSYFLCRCDIGPFGCVV